MPTLTKWAIERSSVTGLGRAASKGRAWILGTKLQRCSLQGTQQPTKDGLENVGGEASAVSLSQTEPLSPQVIAGTALCAAQLRGESSAPAFSPSLRQRCTSTAEDGNPNSRPTHTICQSETLLLFCFGLNSSFNSCYGMGWQVPKHR